MEQAEIAVNERVLRALEGLALKSYPNEAVASLHGYIVTLGGLKVRAVVSLAADTYIAGFKASPRSIHFQLDSASLNNPSWIGMWHSHPEGADELSPEDLETTVSLAEARGGPVVGGVTAISLLEGGRAVAYVHVFKLIDTRGRVLAETRIRRVVALF